LIHATHDALWQVKENAAEAIGKLGAVDGIPALGVCLEDAISNVRKTAVAALGEIGHPDGLLLVEKAMEDDDPDVRKLARWAKERIAE
jgi:HEAT repeat protein